MKCKNYVCNKEGKGKRGYCLNCLHSSTNVVAQCKMCDMTYSTTFGMEKVYCSARCRSRAYRIKKKLGILGLGIDV